MDAHRSLKIIEVCKVTPSSEESSAPKSLPLTFFDILWLRVPPSQYLYFYQLSSNDTSFVDSILPNLKTSLALALRYYLPLAGNLVWPQQYAVPTVEFVEGDGVLLTVAESNADFYHLSGNGFREVEEYHPLVPLLSVSDDRAAVLAVQITVFGNIGFSIGITKHHAVLDGRTSSLFLKVWACLCNLLVTGESSIPTAEFMPFYDRSVIEDSRGLAAMFANAWMNLEGPNNRSLKLNPTKTTPGLVRYTLNFSHQNIQKLKQWILREQKLQISSFALTYAYVCVCIAKFEGLREGNLWAGFLADARSRFKPPVPLSYFGNCLVGHGIGIERRELWGEKGVVVASTAIAEAVRDLQERILDGAEALLSERLKSMSKDFVPKFRSVSWSPKFEVYKTDFGWGKPRKVEIVSAASPTGIALTDAGNGDGGIDIGVVKTKDEMESFVALFDKGLESDFKLHVLD